jgi:hypothetical protein
MRTQRRGQRTIAGADDQDVHDDTYRHVLLRSMKPLLN